MILLINSTLPCYLKTNQALTRNYQCFYTTQTIIKNDKQHHRSNCKVPSIGAVKDPYEVYFQSVYLKANKNAWTNQWFAKYYHVKTIQTDKHVPLIPFYSHFTEMLNRIKKEVE